MFAAPDVYASPEALDNLIPHLNDRARIVAFGAKLSTRPLGRLFNPVIKLLIRLSFSTTPKPELEPLRILSNYVEDLVIDEYFFGLMFLASATLSNKK